MALYHLHSLLDAVDCRGRRYGGVPTVWFAYRRRRRVMPYEEAIENYALLTEEQAEVAEQFVNQLFRPDEVTEIVRLVRRAGAYDINLIPFETPLNVVDADGVATHRPLCLADEDEGGYEVEGQPVVTSILFWADLDSWIPYRICGLCDLIDARSVEPIPQDGAEPDDAAGEEPGPEK